MRQLVIYALATMLAMPANFARAQSSAAVAPRPAQPVFSMGQPPIWQPYAAGFGSLGTRRAGGGLLAGVHRPVLNPVNGIFGLSAEAYAIAGVEHAGAGARALAATRALGISAGVDWLAGERFDFVLSYESAIRRGGLFGRGTMLRLDWLPTRARTLDIGVDVPLHRPFAGRTRPRDTDAELPNGSREVPRLASPLPPAANAALETVAEAATLIRAYNNLYSDENERTLLATVSRYRTQKAPGRLSYGQSYGSVVRSYAEALAQAFGSAAGQVGRGDSIARRARDGVLGDVILPFDSLFGQVKSGPGLRGLTAAAHARFAAWARDTAQLAPAARDAVIAVHDRWLAILEQVHDDLFAQWKDSREVWLPLQLVLTPDQYDEQQEVDALIARAIGRPFTDRNALTYLHSTDLPLEIARSIYAAREYHVLWTHDFQAQKKSGAIDNIGYSLVADVYLPALTEAVQRYDSVGRLPVYMILLDEFWNEVTKGRIWMTMLEDPLRASMRLPGSNADREAHLRKRQEELRAAVARSARLQREAALAGGDGWIRRVVKVHVSITQPADFSFRSHRSIPPLPLTPDNVFRDHRKLALYDLTEADPYRGGVIVMGVGIGEHYASATWEDRGYRLRGPAALEARVAVRALLRRNGFSERDIPEPLRPVASAPGAEERPDLRDYAGRALQTHNEVGFGKKDASVLRAMLYNLAPPGTVLLVPDPLWLSESWAAMLAGAAARGSRVFIIAPASANAPSPEAAVLSREHDVMRRLLEIRRALPEQFTEAKGEIRVGLYSAKAHVNDVEGIRREVRAGLDRAPWIRELVPFDSATFATLERAATQTAAGGEDATDLARDEHARPPLLHQKTQLIARPGAIQALVRQPGWDDVLARAMRAQSQQSARVFEQLSRTSPAVADDAIRSTDALLRGYELALPEADRRRVSFYFSLGTQNMDPRGMMQDGETTVTVSGFHAAAGLVDVYFLMVRSTWIESQQELDALVPPPKWWVHRLARAIKAAL